MTRMVELHEVDIEGRNERGELDVVRLSWNPSGIIFSSRPPSDCLPEIERQLKDHDWTQLPAEVTVGEHPDRTWTIYLPPSVDLLDWVGGEKAFWVDYLIYLEDELLDGEEEKYRANIAWLEEAHYSGA